MTTDNLGVLRAAVLRDDPQAVDLIRRELRDNGTDRGSRIDLHLLLTETQQRQPGHLVDARMACGEARAAAAAFGLAGADPRYTVLLAVSADLAAPEARCQGSGRRSATRIDGRGPFDALAAACSGMGGGDAHGAAVTQGHSISAAKREPSGELLNRALHPVMRRRCRHAVHGHDGVPWPCTDVGSGLPCQALGGYRTGRSWVTEPPCWPVSGLMCHSM